MFQCFNAQCLCFFCLFVRMTDGYNNYIIIFTGVHIGTDVVRGWLHVRAISTPAITTGRILRQRRRTVRRHQPGSYTNITTTTQQLQLQLLINL